MPRAHATDRGLVARARSWAAQAALWVVRTVAQRQFEAAKTGRRTDGWRTSGSSANAAITPALAALRNRSRDLVRNNPHARKAIDTLVSGVVGSGLVPSFPADRDDVRQAWAAFVRECDADGQLDFYGLQTLGVRAMAESGEVLVRIRRRRLEDGLVVPLQLQVLESDHLDSSRNESLAGGGRIVAGIELDAIGRRVAYWLFSDHPGEAYPFGRAYQSKRVPADQVIHLYEKLRPGQMRGVPRLAAAMMRMRDLDDYEEAELVRKGIEACFAAFVTSPEADPGLTAGSTDGDGRRIETLGAGMIQYLRPGETVQFGAPQTAEGYAEYTSTQLHAIAAGAGVTYEQLTGDLSQVNYSSIRAGLLEFRRMVDTLRWQLLVPVLLNRVQAEFALMARASGAVRRDVPAWEWTAPRWEWVDPLKEVEAAAAEVRMGLSSLSEKLRERGMDPDRVFAEIAAERAKLAKLGITLETTQSPAARALLKEADEEVDSQSNRRAA